MAEDWADAVSELEVLRSAIAERDGLTRGLLGQLAGQLERLAEGVERIAERQDGNADALESLLVRRLEELEAVVYDLELASAPHVKHAGAQASPEADMGVVAYADLVRAVREAVRHHTSRDATILVISRGDERLLNLYGRRAWHFPRTAQGYFAGEHPGDVDEILDTLDRWRDAGAEYLLLPSTAFWWLDHYSGLSDALTKRFSIVTQDEDVMIFDLRPPSADRQDFRPAAAPETQGQLGLVSVILPVHNAYLPTVGSEWFRQTIDSFQGQEGMDRELIIVNDGSVDETRALLVSYDPRSIINVVDLQKTRGYGAAVNIGIEASTGSVIALAAAGDWANPDKLARQYSAMEEHGFDVVGCGARVVEPKGAELEVLLPPQDHADILKSLASGMVFAPGTLMFRKAVWQQVGGFSRDPAVRFAEDYDFLVRVAKHGWLHDRLAPRRSLHLPEALGSQLNQPTLATGSRCFARKSAGSCSVASVDGSRDSLRNRCRGPKRQAAVRG